MITALVLLGIAFDLLLLLPLFWKFRIVIVLFTSILHVTAIALLAREPFTLALSLSILVLSFRLINNTRIFYNRKQHYLTQSLIRRSYVVLALLQIFALLSFLVLSQAEPFDFIQFVAVIQFAVALAALGFVVNSIYQTKYHGNNEYLSDKELPALTVAIPARNETDDLQACLESILSSNYPKLEVLVLDDCSQDNTPEVIKQYAHAGVRFLQGTPPGNDWLAKNYAYKQLAEEASGSYILFCGVDVRIAPNYLRSLLTHMVIKKKRMMSVLPTRLGGDIRSSFVQPMRYWRELALPRKLLNRPAVLSTCWVIQSKVLKNLGSFETVKQNILPERHFARQCVAHDTYSFIRADESLDLRTTKQPQHQLATAYRVRYPQFNYRLEAILLYVLGLQLFLVLPYVFFVGSFFIAMPVVQLLSGLTILALTLSHTSILTISDPSNSLFGIITLPFVVISETFLSLYSMLRYEFGAVSWKGRNVCLPAVNRSPN